MTDLVPVTLGVISPIIWVTHPSLPARAVNELVGLAKARPGQIAYSTPGTGSVHHVTGEWLKLISSQLAGTARGIRARRKRKIPQGDPGDGDQT